MAALIGWLARPPPQRLDQPTSGLLELLETDSTVGSSVAPMVPPVADPDHVPLEIRVGLLSQSPVTAFQPEPDVLCRNQNGSLIPSKAG